MTLSPVRRNIVLSILFFLPVCFIILMLTSKENYNTLDIVNNKVRELPSNTANIKFKDHITVLSFLGKNPNNHAVGALNLKEIIYDSSKGFKTFQVVVLVPFEAKAKADALLKKIKSYEDLRFWHFVTATETDIKRIFNSLKSKATLDANLATNSVFIIDKALNQRGRWDDRDKKEIKSNKPVYPLFDYDCIDIGVLKNKLAAEDIRVLFTEYRQKRKGTFENSSSTRRNQTIKNDE